MDGETGGGAGVLTPLAWMIGASVGAWLVLTFSAGDLNPEALFGMLGPLASACVTWVVVTRGRWST